MASTHNTDFPFFINSAVTDNPEAPPPITTISGFDCENEIFGIAVNANADSEVFKIVF